MGRSWALTPEQADRLFVWTAEEAEILAALDDSNEDDEKERDELNKQRDDRIQAALGAESYKNLKALMKAKGVHLKDLAESCGMTPTNIRDGVKRGSRFPQKHGAFETMCRQLGFPPSKAGEMLGGIYGENDRSEAIDARSIAVPTMMEMHDLYDQINDPTDKQLAKVAIYATWRQLKLLAERQG